MTLTTELNVIKLFLLALRVKQIKLECLYLTLFFLVSLFLKSKAAAYTSKIPHRGGSLPRKVIKTCKEQTL